MKSTVCDVLLREVTEADLPVLFEYQRDPTANRLAAVLARDLDGFIAHWAKLRSDPSVVLRTIVAEGATAGHLVSWELGGERVVGYWIGQEYWGRGIMTKALPAFLQIVVARPLYAHVAKHNTASRRALERCGFRVVAEGPVALGETGETFEEYILRLDAQGGGARREGSESI